MDSGVRPGSSEHAGYARPLETRELDIIESATAPQLLSRTTVEYACPTLI